MAFPGITVGQTAQWNGGSGSWSNPAHWDCNCVPNSNYTVFIVSGTATIMNKGTICNDVMIAGSANKVMDNHGEIKGSGTIEFSVNNLGYCVMMPGNSPGKMTIMGSLNMNSNGGYISEISGNAGPGATSGHDLIEIGQSGQLGGKLDVQLIDGYNPTVGSSTILTCGGGCSGTFDEVYFPATETWEVHYDPSAVSISVTSLLPITFLAFDVVAGDDGTVSIHWSTSLEDNTELFRIERSVDGQTWELIGTQLPQNTSETTTYQFMDIVPSTEDRYLYRIEVLELDGSSSFTELKEIKFHSAKQKSISPNYSSGNPIKVRLASNSDVSISVINHMGRYSTKIDQMPQLKSLWLSGLKASITLGVLM